MNLTYGITRLVSLGKEPTRVPLDLMSHLMLRHDREGKLMPPKLLRPGDQVTLNRGPFTDSVATIKSIVPDWRVLVLIGLMEAQTRVAVASDQLRSIAMPSAQ